MHTQSKNQSQLGIQVRLGVVMQGDQREMVARKQQKRRDPVNGVVEANQGLNGLTVDTKCRSQNGVSGDTTKLAKRSG